MCLFKYHADSTMHDFEDVDVTPDSDVDILEYWQALNFENCDSGLLDSRYDTWTCDR